MPSAGFPCLPGTRDAEARQIAFIGTVKGGSAAPVRNATEAEPVKDTISALALRLKIDDDGKISGARQPFSL